MLEILVIIVTVVLVPLEKVHLWVTMIVNQQIGKKTSCTEKEIKIEMIIPLILQKEF